MGAMPSFTSLAICIFSNTLAAINQEKSIRQGTFPGTVLSCTRFLANLLRNFNYFSEI